MADFSLDQALSQANLAKGLDETERRKIADEVVRIYNQDEHSRSAWLKQNKEWMKLALQVMEKKTFPWDGASNVKYPLLTVAALQFASRAYPALVNSQDIVKAKVFGEDESGKLAEQAENVSKHMSYQLLYEIDGWEEGMDKLCYILPIIGTCFKKIYYDPVAERNCSELILPEDLVINYWATTMASARKTHKLWYSTNQIRELIGEEYYLDYDESKQPGQLARFEKSDITDKNKQVDAGDDPFTPRLLLEQHTWLDLDKDGYLEPYVVTVDKESGNLLRIGARFRQNDVKRRGDKIISITPAEYFVKYEFLPNPDGGFYGTGFGLLLGGVNEALNTLINQLIDAGTLNNLQAGFMSKGIRVNKGPQPLRPGEWVPVNNFGDDLRKGIFPLPTKEPSPVLFQLLGILSQTGREIASVSEQMVGKFPGQNTPASTTSAMLEEGMKVFTSIHKRIHRTTSQEFRLFYKMNQVFLPSRVEFTMPLAGTKAVKTYVVSPETYSNSLQGENEPGETFVALVLSSDPSMINDSQKVLKTQQLLEIQQALGTLNPLAITEIAIENIDVENKAQLMQPPPPNVPPEIQLKQAELEETKRANQANEKLAYLTLISESQKRQSEAALNYAKAQQLGNEAGIIEAQAEAERVKTQEESLRKLIELQFKAQEHQMEMQQSSQEHQQEMTQSAAEGQQKLVHNEMMANAKVEQMKRTQNGKTAQKGTSK